MHSSWSPPHDYRNRPVAVLGAGVLGRRIGCIWASAGYDVHLRDPSPEQLASGIAYIHEQISSYASKTGCIPGQAHSFTNFEEAVESAWLVIEAVPEKLPLKIATFADLSALAPNDSILASNSSSYKTSEMLDRVPDAVKPRILNMHYYMPPQCMTVELMTDGFTHEDIFPFMVERCREGATSPYVARKQSTGFIFNRLWAAVKREVLTILSEGVSVPEEIDAMWEEMFIRGRTLPCRMMDNVGLDTVAFIEQHYIHERGLSSERTVDYLTTNYLEKGRLGAKCALGGLYPLSSAASNSSSDPSNTHDRRLLVLDVGLASSTAASSISTPVGQILSLAADGTDPKVLVINQLLPDGIAVDTTTNRIFWTNMGVPGRQDGAVYSSALDGSDIQTVLEPGAINTPKQLTLDQTARKLYFSDREGCAVYRCNLDGSDLETLVSRQRGRQGEGVTDVEDWCVGIAVSTRFNRFYWTQKGAPKSGKGRIFSAAIHAPPGVVDEDGDGELCILSGLPEPIDLEIDEEKGELYWTDRGELPQGNALYRVGLDVKGRPVGKPEILARGLHEAIGVSLDRKTGDIFLTDLGGGVYRCDRDGKRKDNLYQEDGRAFTGIVCV
ncbi:hypothetical protein ASPACDRAFT_1860733 [Aspergillus aculeatus ATCC 16872]|uniref:Uncharacterized protein n=1 Tax=Aspergillus aculeatus (strain ATCC 16872 / CBS 172.66 / WB 5094) TaxID=690307 RepID=A0A1L9WEV7_ASPA1|nr:uncharacterized protein ASPACDRAFT_1860733 [Aspergillus aculeatus ATCC 16872]OJJ94716.1 hypothetical protein ASPACDRAFT_1860733 [Aspergillus aculeatus ATCC 16872]